MLKLPNANALLSLLSHLDIELHPYNDGRKDIATLTEIVGVSVVNNTVFGIIITRNSNGALYLHLIDLNSLLIIGRQHLITPNSKLNYSHIGQTSMSHISVYFTVNNPNLYSNNFVRVTRNYHEFGVCPLIFKNKDKLEDIFIDRKWNNELGIKYHTYISDLINKYLLKECLEALNRINYKHLYTSLSNTESTYSVLLNDIKQMEKEYLQEFSKESF